MITEDSGCFFEGDAVFHQICSRLVRIPFERQRHIVVTLISARTILASRSAENRGRRSVICERRGSRLRSHFRGPRTTEERAQLLRDLITRTSPPCLRQVEPTCIS